MFLFPLIPRLYIPTCLSATYFHLFLRYMFPLIPPLYIFPLISQLYVLTYPSIICSHLSLNLCSHLSLHYIYDLSYPSIICSHLSPHYVFPLIPQLFVPTYPSTICSHLSLNLCSYLSLNCMFSLIPLFLPNCSSRWSANPRSCNSCRPW